MSPLSLARAQVFPCSTTPPTRVESEAKAESEPQNLGRDLGAKEASSEASSGQRGGVDKDFGSPV